MDDLIYQLDLLKATNHKLVSEERMYQMMVDTSNSAFIYYNFISQKVKMLGNWNHYFDFQIYNSGDFSLLYDSVEEKYVIPLQEAIQCYKQGKTQDSVQIKMKKSQLWLEVEVSVVFDGGVPSDCVIRFKDVTKFNVQRDELTYMAYYDMLTGLYNRNYFIKLLIDYIKEADRTHKNVSVMFLDLDDFRRINDSLGIVSGDELVQQFGQFLSEFSSDNVIVSHFNSDIFCIAIYDSLVGDMVHQIYQRILNRCKDGFRLSDGHDLHVSVTVGVAEYPDSAGNALELINSAEIVMFKAKEKGKNSIQFFDTPILQEFLRSVEIENKLKEAVFDHNFMMHFQPQYDIRTGKMRGVEALIRWRDDDGHMISPATFIPIAEQNGAIIPIGNWIIEDSIRRYTEWQKKYPIPFILSLNISAIQYKQVDFVEKIVQAVRKYHMDPHQLELEITESILIDDYKEITDKLIILRDYGIRISLDDFGTGYSSLSYLKGLPIDTLKIDKSFIDTIITDENTQIILESILFMAKRLHLETIAEGVEEKVQYDFLNEVGCDYIQGYYLSKPLSSEQLDALLKKQTGE